MYDGLTFPELGPRTRRVEFQFVFVDPEIESRISRLDTFQIPRTDNSLQLQSAYPLVVLRWRYRAWTSSELAWHSTRLEAVNATETADVVMAEGVQDIVLVMDNASWIQDARAMSCGSKSMIEPLQCFSTLLAKYSDARVFLVFNDRTWGQEANAISKALLRLPEFQGKRGWEFASECFVARGFAALSLANMLEPRVTRGVRADADH